VFLYDNRCYLDDITRVADMALDWELFHDATVVVSGASGMVGTFLVDVLMARNISHGLNCTIHAVARNLSGLTERFGHYGAHENLRLTVADVTVDAIDVPSADLVIHAASNTHPLQYASDPIGTIMTNVQGTRSMLDLAVRAHARRTVFVSSVEIYGENRPGGAPFTESDMGRIDSNTLRAGYPESKRTGETLCQAFRAQYGIDVVIPRLPRVFGPTMRVTDTKAASQFLLRAIAGEDIVLKSDGEQQYSFCHVSDAVSAILTCLTAGQSGDAYNVAHPSCDVRLKDLAQIVAEKVGRAVVFASPDAQEAGGYSQATLAVMDGSKLAGLGWAPHYDIREGINRTVDLLKETLV